MGDGDALVERDVELGTLDDAMDQARAGAGGVVLVEGPSGIGKTSLIRAARARARTAGVRVLSARCAPLEADLAFGVVRQLFEPVLAALAQQERVALMAGAASLAQAVFAWPDMGDRAPPATAEILIATLQGLYWLTSNLAERGPLLLLVDDAHWSDLASLRYFEFLSRRIDELPVALGMSLADTGDRAPPAPLLEIAATPATTLLRPATLTEKGVAELAGSAFASPPEDGFLACCRDVTGGNPFLLRELFEELQRRSISPTDDRAEDVCRIGPRAVAHWVQLRLARLPDHAGALARAVAILGDAGSPGVAAELAGLSPAQGRAAADALAAAGILEPGPRLAFRQTILGVAVYSAMPRGERATGHARAAELLHAAGGSPEQVVAHLLRTDPRGDAATVATLRLAASRAMANGAPDVAMTCLRRALAEPPTPADRGRVLIEFCTAAARQASPASFEELRRQLPSVDDRRERAEIALELARGMGMVADMSGALEVLDQTLRELGDDDPDVGLILVADLISVARLHPETRVAAMHRLRQLQRLATPDELAGSVLLANLAMDMVERGEPATEAVALAEQALRGGALLAQERWVYAYAANTLMWADRADGAERAWTEAFERSNQRGSASMAHLAAVWRSHLHLRTGNLAAAEADARVGLNICRQQGWTHSRSYALAFLVDVLLERGETESAAMAAAEPPSPRPLHYLHDSLGRLCCAQGRYREGLDHFIECGNQLEAQGGGGNPAVIAWRSNAAVALAALDRDEEARGLAEVEVDLARAFGAPRALGIALRVRALTAEGDARAASLDEAVALLEQSGAGLEHARARADRGALWRREGRRSDAEQELRRAMELAHRCGALRLRGQIHDELLRSGLRPRRFTTSGVEALTASERRVAELAAAGKGNREMAHELYVSLKTVEAHLSSVYRKLGITARSQLADRVSEVRPAGS